MKKNPFNNKSKPSFAGFNKEPESIEIASEPVSEELAEKTKITETFPNAKLPEPLTEQEKGVLREVIDHAIVRKLTSNKKVNDRLIAQKAILEGVKNKL